MASQPEELPLVPQTQQLCHHGLGAQRSQRPHPGASCPSDHKPSVLQARCHNGQNGAGRGVLAILPGMRAGDRDS